MSYARVTEVKALDNYEILVAYSSGEKRVFDVSPYLDRGRFRELRDMALFRTVRPCFDSVEWANGVDICPDVLYSQSVVPRRAAEQHTSYET